MDLLRVLLQQLFGKEQCGGETMSVTIHMCSATLCSQIERYSTCGGDNTTIRFNPPILLEEALLKARDYKDKGSFSHGNG